MRNDCRIDARDMMKFRPLAWWLNFWETNWSWENLFKKQAPKYNVSGDAVCKKILESAKRTRASVNKMFGVFAHN